MERVYSHCCAACEVRHESKMEKRNELRENQLCYLKSMSKNMLFPHRLVGFCRIIHRAKVKVAKGTGTEKCNK